MWVTPPAGIAVTVGGDVSQIIVPANPGVVRLGSGKLFTVIVMGFDSTAHPFLLFSREQIVHLWV